MLYVMRLLRGVNLQKTPDQRRSQDFFFKKKLVLNFDLDGGGCPGWSLGPLLETTSNTRTTKLDELLRTINLKYRYQDYRNILCH